MRVQVQFAAEAPAEPSARALPAPRCAAASSVAVALAAASFTTTSASLLQRQWLLRPRRGVRHGAQRLVPQLLRRPRPHGRSQVWHRPVALLRPVHSLRRHADLHGRHSVLHSQQARRDPRRARHLQSNLAAAAANAATSVAAAANAANANIGGRFAAPAADAHARPDVHARMQALLYQEPQNVGGQVCRVRRVQGMPRVLGGCLAAPSALSVAAPASLPYEWMRNILREEPQTLGREVLLRQVLRLRSLPPSLPLASAATGSGVRRVLFEESEAVGREMLVHQVRGLS